MSGGCLLPSPARTSPRAVLGAEPGSLFHSAIGQCRSGAEATNGVRKWRTALPGELEPLARALRVGPDPHRIPRPRHPASQEFARCSSSARFLDVPSPSARIDPTATATRNTRS